MPMTAFLIRLDRETHARFKSRCALRGESMIEVLRRAVAAYLDEVCKQENGRKDQP